MKKLYFVASAAGIAITALFLFGKGYIGLAESAKMADPVMKAPLVVKGDRYCGTDHSPAVINAQETDRVSRLKARGALGVAAANVTGGVVDVYFHVLTDGTNGDLRDS